MPLVSVIMPSLNVASYISECLDSVIHQTLKGIEILCIDAGSTDGTLEIIREYAKKDHRIRLIRSSKRSYGYQMNLGLAQAHGEYIGIVETDDFISPEMYETLYTYAKQKNADFVKSDFDVFTTLHQGERLFLEYSLERHSGIQYEMVYAYDDFIRRKQTVDVFIWNGIYKKSFLTAHRIRFQETPGAAFQDCGFRYQVVWNLEKGFFLNRFLYHYRRDNIQSSTYNGKCVAFNLAEARNLIRLVQEEFRLDKNGLHTNHVWDTGDAEERVRFLAKEISVIALAPYQELLTWGKPARESIEALNEFRSVLKGFIDQGILDQTSVKEDAWLEIRMFVENPEFYDYYSRLRAEIRKQNVQDFLRKVAEKEEVVLFGSGYIGAGAYCLIRNNGIHNIRAFCDNDPKKWNQTYMGCRILSPDEAWRRFPHADYLITNRVHADVIQKQLLKNGITAQQIMRCPLSVSPLECTNIVMRLSNME